MKMYMTLKNQPFLKAMLRLIAWFVMGLLLLQATLYMSGRTFDMAIIPNSNVNLSTNVRDILNAAGGNVTNDIKTFFTENANINPWSFRKPYNTDADKFKLTDEQIRDINCGLIPFQMNSYTELPSIMDGEMNGWEYRLPMGIYRLGDFCGYKTDAYPMIAKFVIADKVSNQTSVVKATAIVNQQDGVQVSLTDLGKLGDYKPAVYLTNGTINHRYDGRKTFAEGGLFDVDIIGTELTVGTWTAYPFIFGGNNDNIYYTLPNVSAKSFEVVVSLDDVYIQARFLYNLTTGSIDSVQYKFSVTNNSGGSTKNNSVYITKDKNDTTPDIANGEYYESLPDLAVTSLDTYNYPYDYNGNEWARISSKNFLQSNVQYVVISIGGGRLIASANILKLPDIQ